MRQTPPGAEVGSPFPNNGGAEGRSPPPRNASSGGPDRL